MLTQSELENVWRYCPDDGLFTRLLAVGKTKVGDVANCHDSHGYIVIKISQKNYKAHRLAWLYMKGHFPNDEIDHRNSVRTDNRWCNLRDATKSINQQNQRKAHPNNTSGFLGVSWESIRGKWRVQIKINAKVVTLGRFDDKLEAAAFYLKKKRELHPGCTV